MEENTNDGGQAPSELRKQAEKDFKLAQRRFFEVLGRYERGRLKVTRAEFSDTTTPPGTAAELQRTLEKLISTRQESKAKPTRTDQVQNFTKRFIKSSYPFAKILFGVLKDGASVYPESATLASAYL